MSPTYELQDRERILRLQCLAAAEPSPSESAISMDALLKRAERIYDFVTQTGKNQT